MEQPTEVKALQHTSKLSRALEIQHLWIQAIRNPKREDNLAIKAWKLRQDFEEIDLY